MASQEFENKWLSAAYGLTVMRPQSIATFAEGSVCEDEATVEIVRDRLAGKMMRVALDDFNLAESTERIERAMRSRLIKAASNIDPICHQCDKVLARSVPDLNMMREFVEIGCMPPSGTVCCPDGLMGMVTKDGIETRHVTIRPVAAKSEATDRPVTTADAW